MGDSPSAHFCCLIPDLLMQAHKRGVRDTCDVHKILASGLGTVILIKGILHWGITGLRAEAHNGIQVDGSPFENSSCKSSDGLTQVQVGTMAETQASHYVSGWATKFWHRSIPAEAGSLQMEEEVMVAQGRH